MTYCLSIMTREGLVMASDSRTNAGSDDLNVARKMHTFVQPGERVFIILSSGSLSLSQSVMNLLRASFDAGEGLAQAASMYEAAREVGEAIRQVADLDRAALERDSYSFNVHLLLGGQVRGEAPCTFLIYPQGNPLSSTEDSPYLQLGECKYGRPILDRGIVYDSTSLKSAAKYALLSFDATMRSNVTVGPPIEIVLYRKDSFQLDNYRRFRDQDPELMAIHALWERSLRNAVEDLPDLVFGSHPSHEEQPVLI
jgi:putative proteasome-type protease